MSTSTVAASAADAVPTYAPEWVTSGSACAGESIASRLRTRFASKAAGKGGQRRVARNAYHTPPAGWFCGSAHRERGRSWQPPLYCRGDEGDERAGGESGQVEWVADSLSRVLSRAECCTHLDPDILCGRVREHIDLEALAAVVLPTELHVVIRPPAQRVAPGPDVMASREAAFDDIVVGERTPNPRHQLVVCGV